MSKTGCQYVVPDIKNEDLALKELLGIFDTNLLAKPLEIEILPSALVTSGQLEVAKDDHYIGIPKQLLGLAMGDTIRSFFVHRSKREIHDSSGEIDSTLGLSAVLLLIHPEHLSAANFRKRHLLRLGNGGNGGNEVALRDALMKELYILDSLLASPLNRHSKSPVLWNHRRWLIFTFFDGISRIRSSKATFGGNIDATDPQNLSWCDLVEHELNMVTIAGTRHPLNYTAWDYARKLLGHVSSDGRGIASWDEIAALTLPITQDWCFRNPGDTSGWCFMLLVLHKCSSETYVHRATEKIIDLAHSRFWHQQSVWMTVQTLLVDPTYALTETASSQLITRLQCIREELDHCDLGNIGSVSVDAEQGNLEEVLAHRLLQAIEATLKRIQGHGRTG